MNPYATRKGNQFLSPLLDWHMRTIEQDVVAAAASAKKCLTALDRWANITGAEQLLSSGRANLMSITLKTAHLLTVSALPSQPIASPRRPMPALPRLSAIDCAVVYPKELPAVSWEWRGDLPQDSQPDKGGYTWCDTLQAAYYPHTLQVRDGNRIPSKSS